jgi:hypothetical protein
MELGYNYNFASGPELQNAFCLAYRFEAGVGFKPDAGESRLLQFDGTTFRSPMIIDGWLTCLWRSDAGLAYVTDHQGRLHIVPSHGDRTRPRSLPVGGLPIGVWGLDDSNVWVWGRRGGEGTLAHFDGTTVREMECPGKLLWVHGLAPDMLVAVGERGLISVWDGTQWRASPPVSNALLSSVHVVSPDEMYACGKGGELLNGSVRGWSLRYRHEGPLGAVVKWNDRVWVAAAGDYGLSELVDDRLESRKPNLLCTYLDYRGDLLISCPDIVAGTSDGEKFRGTRISGFVNHSSGVPPSW